MPRSHTPNALSSNSIAERVSSLAKSAGNLSELARLAGVSNSALTRCLNGGAPSIDTARALCAAAGVSIDWLVNGRDHQSKNSSSLRIPFFKVEASAGMGLIPHENEKETQFIDLPIGTLAGTHYSHNSDLFAIQAKGDSMEPTIRSGCLLLVNRSDQQLREGIYVVTRGEAMLVKRTQPRENQILRLKSDNAQYEHEDIDLKDTSQNFHILGRVIWVGNSL